MTNFGLASVHYILKKSPMVTKVGARWIPHLLTDEQICTRVHMAKHLLKKYQIYQKKVFNIFITGDKIWIHLYEPKRKVGSETCQKAKYC